MRSRAKDPFLTVYLHYNTRKKPGSLILKPQPIQFNPVNSKPIIPFSNLIKHPPYETLFVHYLTELAKMGFVREATQLFDKMPELNCEPTVASLNCLLSFLCEKREGLYMVKDVLLKSHEMCIRVESSTFRILVEALCKNGKVKFAREIIGLMGLFDCDPDPKIYSLVLNSLCKESNRSVEIMELVQEMKNAGFLPRILDCNNVVGSLAKEGKVDEAYDFINEMRINGVKSDVKSYNLVLAAFSEAEKFNMVHQVFDEMLIMGLVPNLCTFNIYIGSLCKNGDLERAVQMITCMERIGCNADVAICNMIIREFVLRGELIKAKELINEMDKKKIKRNSDTLTIYFDGLRKEGQILNAHDMFVEMSASEKFDLGNLGFSNLICGLCEKGFFCEAIRVLDYMIERYQIPDAKSWESLLFCMKLSCRDIEILSDE